ncbi:AAA family ATPase [Sphingoaurantiacus capsulatus]|uniref:AAA family ATPase n=1 Tax=Sphingoaurantiacus capsulatus TaxID=1771310 RepID=A0ABV7XGX9_9SPHN
MPTATDGQPDKALAVTRFAFPRVRRVTLSNFTLYRLQPNISLDLQPGVHCLAGANGIGKSTFLSTVNYGLTGYVPDPARKFLSADRYVGDAHRFTQHYFDGRIGEKDRDLASVTLEFDVNDQRFSITRGLFSNQNVTRLHVTKGNEVVFDGSDLASYQRADEYKRLLSAAVGLNNFDQFIFLQHFVFTFDESRHLLFWDDRASSQVLFLTFGGDPDEAARADGLKREADQEDSRARNAQYQANNTRKRIQVLRDELGGTPPDADFEALARDHGRLQDALNEAVAAAERAEARLNEAELKFARSTATFAIHRAAYSDIFNRMLSGPSNAASHPVVINSLSAEECVVCHASGHVVVANIEAKLKRQICPLCDSDLAPPSDATALEAELKQLDDKLTNAKSDLDEAEGARTRLELEHQAQRNSVIDARAALAAFEEANSSVADSLREHRNAGNAKIEKTIESLKDTYAEFIGVRDGHYRHRDELRSRYKELQNRLESRYALTEREFVPRFRQLAELFLGIDLSVTLRETAPTELRLEIELDGDARQDPQELSESQRFFIDIALRMSLAQQMSLETDRAPLFIDTPEGSLDIAYEERAGDMFARFVESGHDLLMTANINTSLLLKTLASKCGASRMALSQMTGWTELSDVQQNASQLFENAYGEISAALQNQGGARENRP